MIYLLFSSTTMPISFVAIYHNNLVKSTQKENTSGELLAKRKVMYQTFFENYFNSFPLRDEL